MDLASELAALPLGWSLIDLVTGPEGTFLLVGLDGNRQEVDRRWRELQAAGVPAYAVQNSTEAIVDPQLVARGHFAKVSHSALGGVTVEASRFRLSRTPGAPERAGPTFGEHNFEVLSELLGYDGERIAELAAAGVLQ